MPDSGEMWIKVHDQMPEHPKIGGLSDRAFRLLIETWCWCKRQRNDGRFPLAAWQRMGTARTRAELEAGQHPLVEIITEPADLASIASIAEIANHETPRSPEPRYLVVIHDWLTWQTSNDEITERREKRRRAGSIGNHKRWHLRKDVVDPECEHCSQDRNTVASAIANGSQVRSQTDRKWIAEIERSTSSRDLGSSSPVDQRARDLEAFEQDRFGKGLSLRSYKIAEDYARTCVKRPARSWLNQLGAKIDELIDSDWTDEQITDAVRELGKRGLGPGLLPSVANEMVNSDKATEKPRNVYEIPEDQLTREDVALLIGDPEYDADRPLLPDEARLGGRGAVRKWREEAYADFHRKRLERAIKVRRERLARSAGGPT
jgi:hypothetical protein